MKKIIIAAVFIISILAITSFNILESIYSLEGDSKIEMGRYQFNIPAEYGTHGFMNLSVRWFTRQFQPEEVAVFEIKEHELALNISAYKIGESEHPRNIKGLIRVWNEKTLQTFKQPGRYANLWRGSGPYSGREVHPYLNGKLFRVYRDASSKKVWTVLKQNPLQNDPLPENSFDFWVARCRAHESKMPGSAKFTICNSYLLIDDVVVEFYLAEDNLETIEEIRQYLAEKIISWRSYAKPESNPGRL